MRLVVGAALYALVALQPGVAAALSSSASTEQQIDAYLKPYIASRMFSGVVLVRQRGHRDIMRCFEIAGSPCKSDALHIRFRIASITKTFTAAAIELLAERNVIRYTDSLEKYVPSFPNGRNITIRMLLLHEAGLADPDYAAFAARRASIDDLVASIASRKPYFAPGTSEAYSNAGYILLAKIIEVASGKPYGQFLNDEIFQPLGLQDTVVNDESKPIPGRVPAYVPGPPPRYVSLAHLGTSDVFVGSGILLSSASDLVRWARLFATNRLVDTPKLEYPYGWGVRRYFRDHVIVQSGEITGAISYLGYYRDRGITIVVLSNLETGPNDRIGLALGSIAAGWRARPPSFPAIYKGKMTKTVSDGAYASTVGNVSLTSDGGNRFVQWDGATDRQYLQPISSTEFFVREDSSIVTVESESRFLRSWPGGQTAVFTLH